MRIALLTDEEDEYRVEVERNEAGLIVAGMVLGDSTAQNIHYLLQSGKNEFKQYPRLGAELRKEQLGEFSPAYWRELQIQLDMDGYSMNDINLTTND